MNHRTHFAALALALVAAGCADPYVGLPGSRPGQSIEQQLASFRESTSMRVQGSAAGSGTAIGTFSFAPTTCQSGGRQYFLGADLTEPATRRFLRVAVEPTQGAALVMGQVGTTDALRMTHENCTQLDVDVQPQGVRVGGIQLMTGHATFECQMHSGGAVRGSVTFANCG